MEDEIKKTELYSNMVPPELIAGALTAVSTATSAIANRQRNEIKQSCGSRPLFNLTANQKRKTAFYNKCAVAVAKKYDPELQRKAKEKEELLKQAGIQATEKNKRKMILGIAGAGSLLMVLFFVGIIMYKKNVPLV